MWVVQQDAGDELVRGDRYFLEQGIGQRPGVPHCMRELVGVEVVSGLAYGLTLLMGRKQDRIGEHRDEFLL